MKTLGIMSISYKRPQVLELFCASIQRIKTEMDMFIPCVIVGDAEHYEICSKYQIHFIAQENHPATAKWNRGVDYLMGLGLDYVCILGSDDLCDTTLMKNLFSEMQNGTELIGVSSIYFYSADGRYRTKMRWLNSPKQILGVARCISKEIIYKAGGVLWNKNSSWGMDGICLKNILPHVKTVKIVQGDVFDVKTCESLNKATMWLSKLSIEEDPRKFWSILSEEELQILISIR
jgi:glycosyltransferase involved in cell wall biosynthesis